MISDDQNKCPSFLLKIELHFPIIRYTFNL